MRKSCVDASKLEILEGMGASVMQGPAITSARRPYLADAFSEAFRQK